MNASINNFEDSTTSQFSSIMFRINRKQFIRGAVILGLAIITVINILRGNKPPGLTPEEVVIAEQSVAHPVSIERTQLSAGTEPNTLQLFISGNLSNSCSMADIVQSEIQDNRYFFWIATKKIGDVCAQALNPFEIKTTIDANGLPDGSYEVFVQNNKLNFTVSQGNVTANVEKKLPPQQGRE